MRNTEAPTFPTPNGSRRVMFNSSWMESCALPSLTEERLLELIDLHEKLRIECYWNEAILIEEPYGTGGWIAGLKMTKGAKNFPQQAIFLTSALQRSIGSTKRGRELNDTLRRLPLEEQRAALLSLRPESREGLKDVMSFVLPAFAPDFRLMLKELGSIQAFVDHLIQAGRSNEAPPYHHSRYLEMLALLWSHSEILFPLDLPAWKVKHKYQKLSNPIFAGERIKVVEEAMEVFKLANHKGLQGRAQTFFMASSILSAEEMSLDLIAHYEHLLIEEVNASQAGKETHTVFGERSRANRTGHILRVLFNQSHPELAVSQTRTTKKRHVEGPLRSDGEFLWIEPKKPELKVWPGLFRSYVAQLTTARIAGQIGRLNFFADYLASLETPPTSPHEIVRREHIYDATGGSKSTFYEYLRIEVPDKARASGVLSLIRDFFDWYADYLIASKSALAGRFPNPVLSSDSFGMGSGRRGQTGRDALPSYVMEELKTILVEDDFAFSKGMKGHYETVVDGSNGNAVRAWFPGLAVCLYTMLDTPIRSHQARWLDSGLLDEKTYDAASAKYAVNNSRFALKGRHEGVLHLQHDSLRKADWLGLWVNTNKTAIHDGSPPGYLIPYVSDQLAKMLSMMQAWQARYLPPIVKPVPYYDIKQTAGDRKRIADQGPQVAPLFREPKARTKDAPLTYHRLANFYTKVLLEAQKRIKRKHGHDIKLVTKDEDGVLHWAVDLHTLRVSGITAMIENGVPIEVVSQFVAGHATLVMTLHYLKYSPFKIRAMLADAHVKAEENMDFVGSEMFMGNLDAFAPFLVTQQGTGESAGIGALKEKSGIFTIASDGICPGTSCTTGGPLDSSKLRYGPVLGGQRCGLCRYWITGPAHLLGQVASVNNLAYAIRKKGLEVAALNDERLDAEDALNQRKAREIRDRVDLLNRELGLDIEEWAARYRYAEQSVELLNEFVAAKVEAQGEKLPVPFLTAGTATELKVTLEEAHEFALLDQITQMSEFVTGFTNREAELEKTALLSKMMVANGVKPFLLSLDENQAHEAGNMLSALLLQQVQTRDLDDVLNGRMALSRFPHLSKALSKLEKASENNELTSRGKSDALSNTSLRAEDFHSAKSKKKRFT